MLLINELKLSISESETKLKELIKKRLHLKDESFSYEIKHISIDSRKEPVFSYSVLVKIDNEHKYLSHKNVTQYHKKDLKPNKVNSNERPIIIGYGPSGIFSAYRFIEAGMKPIIFEKGKRIKEREEDVEDFFKAGNLLENSNVQFGEGGAGTFSDCKLTTRIKDPFIDYILDVFIKHGAKKSIGYFAHSHIGTDEARKIITKITNYLICLGAEFHFEEEVEDFIIEDNVLKGIKTNKGIYHSKYNLLCIGHSAYNTIKCLNDYGVSIVPKDTAIGFRVEHPQSLIDQNQYHGYKSDKLGPAEYFLTYKDVKGVYSFCMCPGGLVIPATSNKNRIVTNGMSYSKRDSLVANSAILLQVSKQEYPSGNLGGFEYLKNIEEKAYTISKSYKALSFNIKDYINDNNNDLIFSSTYPLGTTKCNLSILFSQKQNEYFKKALIDFDKKIPGFINKGIMVGPETRSSCPVRIERNINYESINTKNLYPVGEGAGYGGGIMSCALDGIKVANAIIDKMK